MKRFLKRLTVYFFPIGFTLLSIWEYFSQEKYFLWLDGELEKLGLSTLSNMDDMAKHKAYLTSFEKNVFVYVFTLLAQAFTFMLLAYIIRYFREKKKVTVSTTANIVITPFCFIMGHILNLFLSFPAIVYLTSVKLYGYPLPDQGNHEMLFSCRAVFNLLSLSDIFDTFYVFLSWVLQIYIIYVIWLILTDGLGSAIELRNKKDR